MMRKTVIIFTVLALIASGCGQTTKNRAAENSGSQTESAEQSGNPTDIYVRLIEAIETDNET
jgi:uncharacterized protein YceK